jgi:hypothetical protein
MTTQNKKSGEEKFSSKEERDLEDLNNQIEEKLSYSGLNKRYCPERLNDFSYRREQYDAIRNSLKKRRSSQRVIDTIVERLISRESRGITDGEIYEHGGSEENIDHIIENLKPTKKTVVRAMGHLFAHKFSPLSLIGFDPEYNEKIYAKVRGMIQRFGEGIINSGLKHAIECSEPSLALGIAKMLGREDDAIKYAKKMFVRDRIISGMGQEGNVLKFYKLSPKRVVQGVLKDFGNEGIQDNEQRYLLMKKYDDFAKTIRSDTGEVQGMRLRREDKLPIIKNYFESLIEKGKFEAAENLLKENPNYFSGEITNYRTLNTIRKANSQSGLQQLVQEGLSIDKLQKYAQERRMPPEAVKEYILKQYERQANKN